MDFGSRRIQVSGMPEGHGFDKAVAQSMIEKAYDKLEKRLPGQLVMEVHFKEGHVQRKKDGQREQVEAHIKVVVGGGEMLLHSKHVEWSAEKAINGAIEGLEKEAERALSKSRPKN